MALNIGESTTYVIETIADEITSENDSNEVVLIESPLLLCTNNMPPPLYVSPAYPRGRLLLNEVAKKLSTKRLPKTEKSSKTYKKIAKNHPMNQEPVILNEIIKSPRKQMSYETEFKPAKLTLTSTGISKGLIRYGRRQLIIDQEIMINTRQFKNQLNNTNDIISATELAPRSKKEVQQLLHGLPKLFSHPAHKVNNSQLLQLYVSNCTFKEKPNIETITDMELLPIGYQSQIDPASIKRITRKRKYPYMSFPEKNERLKDCTVEQILVEAAKSADDHKYSKEEIEEKVFEIDSYVIEESIPANIETAEIKIDDSDELKTEIKIEEHEVFTIKNREIYTVKSEDEDEAGEPPVVIIQRMGENVEISQKNLEILLAAANDTNQSNQIVAICNSSDIAEGNRYILVQNEDNEEIFGTESEIILSN